MIGRAARYAPEVARATEEADIAQDKPNILVIWVAIADAAVQA